MDEPNDQTNPTATPALLESTTAAREHAKLTKREVDQGLDPLAVRDDRRSAPTMKRLIERYLEEHVFETGA